jgi:Double zinc ribbon
MGRGATAALSIIGGIMLFIGAIVRMSLLRRTLVMESIWDQYQNAVYFQFGITIFFALLAISIGAIAGSTRTNVGIKACGGLLLIFGLVALFGQFLQYEEIGTYGITITVSATLIYIDPLFLVLAGVCGIATNQEYKRVMYMPPPVLPRQPQQIIHIYMPQLPVAPPAPSPVSAVPRIVMWCPHCHVPISNANAKFCGQCGQRLASPNLRVRHEDEDKLSGTDADVSIRFCSSCGKEVTEADLLFCKHCGSALENP